MTDYERLTRYMQVGNKVVQVIPQRKERIQNYVDRLFDLEDKIESGELISKKEVERLKSENVALCNEADENAALSMENKMRADRLEVENAALRERLEKAVELKAKRLDVIYMPWVYDGNFGIATLQIIGIDLRTNGEIAYITNLESDSIIYLAKYSYGIFYNADFDHIVFTDRSKAEALLAELKGGKE